MQKTPIKKNSKTKKAIKYSFKSFLTLLQLNKRQIGINIVVSNRKNNEIPSIPAIIFKFKLDNQWFFIVNWNCPTDFSKYAQTINEPKNGNTEKFKAINFNSLELFGEYNKRHKIPIRGNNRIYINKLSNNFFIFEFLKITI